MSKRRETISEVTSHLLTKTWAKWGAVDDDVLTHLINPAFMGGPKWPALRQAYRVARRPDSILVASDGLSEPFDDEEPPTVNGVQLEVFSTSNDVKTPPQQQVVFKAVWNIAQVCASADVAERLDEMSVISTELHVDMPEAHRENFVNEHGRVGALIGLPVASLPEQVKGPLSRIRIVSLTLLTLDELDFVMGGAKARESLGKRLVKAGLAGTCDLERESLVE
ncbi:MAG: hypothetical protein ACO1OB_05135 [Archangium sp.]